MRHIPRSMGVEDVQERVRFPCHVKHQIVGNVAHGRRRRGSVICRFADGYRVIVYIGSHDKELVGRGHGTQRTVCNGFGNWQQLRAATCSVSCTHIDGSEGGVAANIAVRCTQQFDDISINVVEIDVVVYLDNGIAGVPRHHLRRQYGYRRVVPDEGLERFRFRIYPGLQRFPDKYRYR
jgi:hypothetical protein